MLSAAGRYGVPLPYERKLDQFAQPRATEQYHDRFRYTNDVMDFLHARHEVLLTFCAQCVLARQCLSVPSPVPQPCGC